MPLTVTPALTQYRFGDDASPAFTATGATGTVHWSSSRGFMTPAEGPTSELQVVNRTEIVTITAEDDLGIVTASIQIYATFPTQPKWGVESDVNPPIASWPMVYEKRTFEEYRQVLAFFNWHGPVLIESSEAEDGSVKLRILRGKPFYMADISTGDLVKGYFDSPLRRSFDGLNFANYAFQFRSFEYVISDDPQVGPWAEESTTVTTHRIYYTDDIFKDALSTVSKSIASLANNEYISSVTLEAGQAFAGTGITSTTSSVGSDTPGNGAFYAPPWNIFQAIGNTYEISGLIRDDSSGEIVVVFTANTLFGDGSATVLTGGYIDITITIETITEWDSFTVDFSDPIFTASDTSISKTLQTFTDGLRITDVVIRASQSFSGAGTSTEIELGDLTISDLYLQPFDVFQSPGKSASVGGVAIDGTDLVATFTSDADFGNGTTTNLTEGSVTIWIRREELP